jgi:hypothetical protein
MPGWKSIGYRPLPIGKISSVPLSALPQNSRNGWQSCLCLGQYARNFSNRASARATFRWTHDHPDNHPDDRPDEMSQKK